MNILLTKSVTLAVTQQNGNATCWTLSELASSGAAIPPLRSPHVVQVTYRSVMQIRTMLFACVDTSLLSNSWHLS